jgi:DNA-binding NarL/FixJ family response regulator
VNHPLLESFSNREKEVLQLLSEGYRYKEIADKLFLGVDTVRTYIRNIYSTLQVHSRTDALNKVFGKQ